MKALIAAVLMAVLGSAPARATPTQLSFEAAVIFVAPESPYAGLGPTVVGSYFFNYDPATYTIVTAPGEGSNYGGYEYSGAPFGITANLPELSQTVPSASQVIEVYDNGSLVPTNFITGDNIFFGAKRNAISYILNFTGPDSTFANSSLPSAATLTGSWTSSQFLVLDASLNVALRATVTQVQVSQVPEPSVLSMLLMGSIATLAFVKLKRRSVDA